MERGGGLELAKGLRLKCMGERELAAGVGEQGLYDSSWWFKITELQTGEVGAIPSSFTGQREDWRETGG